MHIVLISRHYADGGSGGARRPWHWVKGLRDAGHKVTLVTPGKIEGDPDAICIPFEKAERNLSVGPNSDAQLAVTRALTVKDRLRNWRYWPDPDVQWYQTVRDQLSGHISTADWLITTSPPESAHRYGRRIADELGAKWCAELRDPWFVASLRAYLKGVRLKLERVLARHWMANVDALVLVHPFMKDTILDYMPKGVPVQVISHFCEPVAEALESTWSDYLPDDRFNLVYAGGFSLSDYRRDIRDCLGPIETAARQREASGLEPIRLTICGKLSAEEQNLLAQARLETDYVGIIAFSDSVALQSSADALLLFAAEGVPTLPGKYADAAALRKPIIFVGDKAVIENVPHGYELFEPQSLESLERGKVMAAVPEIGTIHAVRALVQLLEDAA